jgi:hypothetical protein
MEKRGIKLLSVTVVVTAMSILFSKGVYVKTAIIIVSIVMVVCSLLWLLM